MDEIGFESALPTLAAMLMVRLVMHEAQFQRAKKRADELRFPAGAVLRLVLGLGLPMFLYLTYEMVLIAQRTGEWWLPAMSGLLSLGTVLFLPSEIRIREDGIQESRLLGIYKKLILWEGAAVSYIPELREVLIVSKDGSTITHTQYHVGQDEFVYLLRKRKLFFHGHDKINP